MTQSAQVIVARRHQKEETLNFLIDLFQCSDKIVFSREDVVAVLEFAKRDVFSTDTVHELAAMVQAKKRSAA